MSKYCTVIVDDEYRRACGVLFTNTDGPTSTEDVEAVLSTKAVKDAFGSKVLVVPNPRGFILSNDLRFLNVLPDKAKFEDVVQIGGKKINLYDRFNSCYSLIKHTLGCYQCDEKGWRCLEKANNKQLRTGELSAPEGYGTANPEDKDLLRATFATAGQIIGGFEAVSPMLTRTRDFQETWRRVSEHTFDANEIKDWRALLSDRAKKAALNRKFRDKECARCPLHEECRAFRSCSGHYPPENVITDKVIAVWRERMKNKQLNPFKEWQFWSLARMSGAYGKWRGSASRKRDTTLVGLVWRGNEGFRIEGVFQKGYTGRAFLTADYYEIAEAFDLPLTKEAAGKLGERPELDTTTAVWFETLDEKWTRGRRGFYGSNSHEIIMRRLTGTVDIDFAYARNAVANRDYPPYRLSTWATFWDFTDHRQLPGVAKTISPLRDPSQG